MKNVYSNGKKYYHGSKTEISGGILYPNQAFNSIQDKVCSGVFVTSDIADAKFFAINRCISGNGHTRLEGKKIYLERLSSNIQRHFFVYSLYETLENPFVHDRGTEYYSVKPIQIVDTEKFNTAEEIKKAGYEVYVLNATLERSSYKKTDNNFDVQEKMAKLIEEKKYHRVDIEKEMEKQSKSMFRRIFHTFLQHT